jgi:hypothetical protein
MAAPTLLILGITAPGADGRCPRVIAQQSAGGAPAEERGGVQPVQELRARLTYAGQDDILGMAQDGAAAC